MLSSIRKRLLDTNTGLAEDATLSFGSTRSTCLTHIPWTLVHVTDDGDNEDIQVQTTTTTTNTFLQKNGNHEISSTARAPAAAECKTIQNRQQQQDYHFLKSSYLDLRQEQNEGWADERLVEGIAYAKDPKTHAEAEQSYRKGLEIMPNHSNLLTAYGALVANQGNYNKAIELLNKALQVDPTHQEAKVYKETILNRLRRGGEKHNNGERAKEQQPGESLKNTKDNNKGINPTDTKGEKISTSTIHIKTSKDNPSGTTIRGYSLVAEDDEGEERRQHSASSHDDDDDDKSKSTESEDSSRRRRRRRRRRKRKKKRKKEKSKRRYHDSDGEEEDDDDASRSTTSSSSSRRRPKRKKKRRRRERRKKDSRKRKRKRRDPKSQNSGSSSDTSDNDDDEEDSTTAPNKSFLKLNKEEAELNGIPGEADGIPNNHEKGGQGKDQNDTNNTAGRQQQQTSQQDVRSNNPTVAVEKKSILGDHQQRQGEEAEKAGNLNENDNDDNENSSGDDNSNSRSRRSKKRKKTRDSRRRKEDRKSKRR